MTPGFSVKFVVNRLTANYKIQITDTTNYSGVSTAYGFYRIEYPDGIFVENSNPSTPDFQIGQNFSQFNLRMKNFELMTGQFRIIQKTFANTGDVETTKVFTFSFVEPALTLTNTSNLATPTVSFTDTTDYNSGFYTEVITRSIVCNFPQTLPISGTQLTTTGTVLNMVSSGNYYEGVYLPTLTSGVVLTGTNHTIEWNRSATFSFSIKRLISHSDLLEYLNISKERYDAAKGTTNESKERENYQTVSSLVDHIKLKATEGQEGILELVLEVQDLIYKITCSSPDDYVYTDDPLEPIDDEFFTDGIPLSRTITINGVAQDLSQDRVWNVGTVTSIGVSVPSWMTVSNSPVTQSGVIALGLAAGYYIPTTNDRDRWDDDIFVTGISVSGTGTKTITLTRNDAATISASFSLTTDEIQEDGSPVNLWFTDARARAAVSLTTTGNSGAATYSQSTGILNVPNYTLSGLGGVPLTRTITINGQTFDLSQDRVWNIQVGHTIQSSGTSMTQRPNLNFIRMTVQDNGAGSATNVTRPPSVTVSTTPPTEDLLEGDEWINDNTWKKYAWYDGYWAEVGKTGCGSNFVRISPYSLLQEGATDGQVIIWSGTNNRYEPANISGSKWTDIGANIYRNSRVLVGATAFTDSTARLEVSGRVSQVGLTSSTFFGFEAGLTNSSIGANSAFGHAALRSITTAHSNSAFGWISGYSLQSGIDNSFFGRQSAFALTNGSYNTVMGAAALVTATSASNTTALGYAALFAHPNPVNQTAVGFQALYFDNQGTENTALGARVAENLRNATTNSQNVIIGYFAAQANLTMQNSIIIGRNARPAANGQINQLVIGHDALGLGSNTSAIGNASTVFGRWWGNLLLGTSTNSGDRLRVDGTVRLDTVTSATGDIVTIDANNVLRRQTVAQIGAVIGGGSVGAGIGLSKPASNILLGDNATLFYTDTPTVKDFFLYQVGTNNLTALYSGFGATAASLGEAGFAATNSAGSRGAEIKVEYNSADPNPFAKIQINNGAGSFNVFSSDQTNGYRVRDDIHQRGLVEHADYSGNKTDLSYTTIAWMKSRTNYNASVAQYFTHDSSGNFAWVNI